MNISWLKMTYKHLLLPIWLLTVSYEQKPFRCTSMGLPAKCTALGRTARSKFSLR